MGRRRSDLDRRPGIAFAGGARRALRLAWLALALVLAATGPRVAAAQSYFGQNQVRFDDFDWRVLETEHFLVHYYPAIEPAARDAARMAERAYARLSRILDHQFREKKPIVLFASRTDFAQNNVTGDLGEATGGVTESLRHRMLLFFTGDYRSFERVLTHEMAHAFQFDVFARGRAGAGLQTLAQANMPLWFTEGMAEYLAVGPVSTSTDQWLRDAALHGRLPTVRQMTERPDRYFPYRFGHALWTHIAARYGDEAVGQLLAGVPAAGVERAFRRELGVDLEELAEEWRETMQTTHLARIGEMERPRHVAEPLLSGRQSRGGEVFLSPALSSDGRHIAFLANGRYSRGEVFIDLWLGDGRTGERLERLAKSTTSQFEELRFLYSQSAFSPDGSTIAFTAQRRGRDVLVLMDVRRRRITRILDVGLETALGPTFSPDGRRIAFSGMRGGISDLYVVDVDGRQLVQLTNDRFADIQPAWSQDGRRIAFATDRGQGADLSVLTVSPMRIAVMELDTRAIELLPGQEGASINPQWAPDDATIAYVSDRSGIPNVFLYDFDDRAHFQLTNVIGGVAGMTELSPAISWAPRADRLAFTHFDEGRYTVWAIANPRARRKGPFHGVIAQSRTVERRAGFDVPDPADSTYRPAVSVAELLDSTTIGLPDPSEIGEATYAPRLHPDYVARPSIGYAPDAYGRNVFGGTTVVLSDLLGDHRVGFAAEVNGRWDEARLFAGYSRLAGRWQYSGGVSQSPFYFLSAERVTDVEARLYEEQEITTYLVRQAFVSASYPFSRFNRLELGLGANAIAVRRSIVHRDITDGNRGRFTLVERGNGSGLDYLDAQLAWVSDNTLGGGTGPLAGRRYRFEVNPVIGSLRWMEYLADYRRYVPIVFDGLTLATRAYVNIATGRDETAFPKYIARPDFVRGYDRTNVVFGLGCQSATPTADGCGAVPLLGSRVAVFNAEARFPVVRRIPLGFAPVSLPQVDGVVFFDAGVAWTGGQSVHASRPVDYDPVKHRYPQRSYGFGLRANFFNYAVLRWDYAVPVDYSDRRGFWTWSLWPSF